MVTGGMRECSGGAVSRAGVRTLRRFMAIYAMTGQSLPGCGADGRRSITRNLPESGVLTLTIVAMRPLHAVLVRRAAPRLAELLAPALDGTRPASLPLEPGLPAGRLA